MICRCIDFLWVPYGGVRSINDHVDAGGSFIRDGTIAESDEIARHVWSTTARYVVNVPGLPYSGGHHKSNQVSRGSLLPTCIALKAHLRRQKGGFIFRYVPSYLQLLSASAAGSAWIPFHPSLLPLRCPFPHPHSP